MSKIFYDNFFRMNEIKLIDDGDVFESILESRKNALDKDRFFIDFLPSDEFLKYDFNNRESLREFRNICFTIDTPIMPMGGCNLWEKYMYDMRISGKKISDPYGKIFGCFDIKDGVITYSPLFAHFYNERDVAKFANDRYFTTMTFEETMKYYIEHSQEFYVHTDNSVTISDFNSYGRHILEKISASEMLDFVNNPSSGELVLKKSRYR